MIKKNVAYNFIYHILIYVIPLITTPYLSRVLGASGIGEYSLAYTIASYFVMFGMLGLSNYGNREIAKVSHDKEKRTSVFCQIYSMQLLTAGLALVSYVVYIFVSPDRSVLKTVMIFYVLSALFDISWLFFGMELFKLTILRNALLRIGTCVMIFLFVKTENQVWIYGGVMAIGSLASQLILWPYLKKYISKPKLDFSRLKTHLSANIVLFVPVVAVSIFKMMDKLMLGIMSNNTQLGYYENSEKLISVPVCFITALGTVMLPRISNMQAMGKDKNVRDLTKKSLVIAAVSSSLIAFGIMGVLNEFIPIFYGTEFEACKLILWIMLPCTVFVAQANVIRTQILIPYSKEKVYMVSVIIGAIVNIIANLIFIPMFQAAGAAIGTFLAEFFVWFYQSYSVRKELPMFKNIMVCTPIVIAGMAMALLLDGMGLFFDSNIISLVLKALIGAVFFSGIVGGYLLLLKRKNGDIIY